MRKVLEKQNEELFPLDVLYDSGDISRSVCSNDHPFAVKIRGYWFTIGSDLMTAGAVEIDDQLRFELGCKAFKLVIPNKKALTMLANHLRKYNECLQIARNHFYPELSPLSGGYAWLRRDDNVLSCFSLSVKAEITEKERHENLGIYQLIEIKD